jgi:uncharacterized protein (DUF305 family)
VKTPFQIVAIVFAATAIASCAAGTAVSEPAVVRPGAPGESSRVAPPGAAAKPAAFQHTDADVKFMQGMIGHHAQALEMTALLYTRTTRADMKLLAERIDVSQTDEIKMMKRWLEARGLAVPSEHAHHMPGATLMPGMLTAEQMARLAAAKGEAFDRLFLEGMIRHHEGAVVMVAELFAAPGAAQESEIFDFASHVDGDQRMEILRMRGMLKGKP